MNHDRAELLKIIESLTPAVSNYNVIPELRLLWFTSAVVRAYDGQLGIEVPFKLGVDCGLPGDLLAELLASSNSKSVTFEYTEKRERMLLKFGSARLQLGAQKSGMIWPFAPSKQVVQVPITKELIDALTLAVTLKPKRVMRIENQGVIVHVDDKFFALYATSDVSNILTLPLDIKNALPHRTMLPFAFCKELIASSWEGGTLFVTPDHLMARCTDRALYSNLLNTSKITDMRKTAEPYLASQPVAVQMPDNLLAALARSQIMGGKDKADVTLEIEDGFLYLAGDFSVGTLDETFALEKSKHPNALGKFASAFLIRAMKDAEKFSITKGALAVYGNTPPFTWLVGGK